MHLIPINGMYCWLTRHESDTPRKDGPNKITPEGSETFIFHSIPHPISGRCSCAYLHIHPHGKIEVGWSDAERVLTHLEKICFETSKEEDDELSSIINKESHFQQIGEPGPGAGVADRQLKKTELTWWS